ncbi:ABC transporter substrate-binding protein [Aliiglaciecola sp. CAU 1673]|uniref:substrate-binding periplasmic protein n=1 Tax=Aliiglaciecola sp. CAU 1673 TaxID=3032595 RepID=UPI0023DB5475|nr:ABC transporter substrate-binding protein [Aliiglaciecola sp. CAU 1673]MDF2179451.1 ABC transporter substrate-binding protein [Aliiglaciecola sp. CAU 1673]
MNAVTRILFRNLPILVMFACPAATADTDLLVSYELGGKVYQVQGSKTADGYLFNADEPGKSLKIMTLNWPPYIGEHTCKQGWVQQLTIALLHSRGYSVLSQFRPWARSVYEVENGMADILYPEYLIEAEAPSDVFAKTKRLDHLALSNSFPGGSIALIKRRGEPDPYQGDLHNLKGSLIGVVRGYQNTPEFDALMDSGYFRVMETTNDQQLAKMLVGNRVDLIIGDPKVIFTELSQVDLPGPQAASAIAKLEVLEPALQYNPLYFALSRKRPQWQQVQADINQALNQFEKAGEIQAIINRTMESCSPPDDDEESNQQ